MARNLYFNTIDKLLRDVTEKNVFEFKTTLQKDVKQFEEALLKQYCDDSFHESLSVYKALLISHIMEIRRADAIDVFVEGFVLNLMNP